MAPRRYRAVGGWFAWRLPLCAGILLAALAASGDWSVTLLTGVLALVASAIERGHALEVSARSLSRELRIAGVHVRAPRVVAWRAVAAIETRWRGPHDYSGLVTRVVGPGMSITFTNAMGYAAYRALVADVVARAPHARPDDLTRQLLREEPPRPRRSIKAAAAFGALLVLLWAVFA